MKTTPPPCCDVVQAVPELAGLARTAVRLHPRRGDEPPRDGSKLGGSFLWPADEPWPTCPLHHGLPYVGVLQLRSEDVPELPFVETTDLLQILWCPQDHDAYGFIALPQVYWRQRATIATPLEEFPALPRAAADEPHDDFDNLNLKNRATWLESFLLAPEKVQAARAGGLGASMIEHLGLPAFDNDKELVAWLQHELVRVRGMIRQPGHARAGYVPEPCQLHFERIVEYPPTQALPQELIEKVRGWDLDLSRPELAERAAEAGAGDPDAVRNFALGLYNRELSACPGSKVGGHVRWHQNADVPLCRCEQPMQHLLTIASWECDRGDWRRWLPVEDQAVMTAGLPAREVGLDTGLMLGDAGSMYFFICRACPDWPILPVFEGS